jgi:hypothetical protein
MARPTSRRTAGLLGWGLLLLCGAGCARRGYERYVPPPAAAQEALEAALGAWQDGRAPGLLESHAPPLMVVDSGRRPGQRLRGYEVLGEVPGDGPRSFAVRLLLDNPPREQKARFVVFGISPLWVFRHEDYEMMAHWDCNAATEKEEARPAGP